MTPDDPQLSSKTAEPDTDWVPTEDPNATVTPGEMRSDREEIPAPFTKEDADKAETMEAKERTSRGILACQTFWPSPYQVCGVILDKYNSLGGPASFLSFPSTGELTNPDGYGKRSQFLNGPIYWSAATGAHPVVNSFLFRWQQLGYESAGGMLGYPTTDEIVLPDGGRRQEFQRGVIYVAFQNAVGSALRNGLIRDKYNSVGGLAPGGTLLGYPIQDPVDLADGGRMNRFQNGVIYWSAATGAQIVQDPVLAVWSFRGYETGIYGYPTGPQYFDNREELVQPFQNGILNVTSEIVAGGVETFRDKEVSAWVMDQLRSLATQNGFDLDTAFTPMPEGAPGARVTPDSAPFPQNPDTGGVEIPENYHYTGYYQDTLHDFCTTSPDEFPSPGANANFRGPCAVHDMCYEGIPPGEGFQDKMRTCDANFRNNLLRVCENVYTGYIDGVRRQTCKTTALGYYSAVVGAHHSNYP